METREALFRFDAEHGIKLVIELEQSYLKRDLERFGITPVILKIESRQRHEVLGQFGVGQEERKCGFLYLSAPVNHVTEEVFNHMIKSASFLEWVSPVVRSSVEA